MPHERAEVSVLEVLRQQLAGELVRLVNRELRAPLGPRHDVVASRVVHHVVPASERGWASVSGAPSLDKKPRHPRRADNKMFVVPRRAHAHFTQEGRRRLARPGPHRARGYVFRRADPLWKGAERRAGRCAREPESTRDPKTHAQRGNETSRRIANELSIRFSRKKCRHRWPRRRGQLARVAREIGFEIRQMTDGINIAIPFAGAR